MVSNMKRLIGKYLLSGLVLILAAVPLSSMAMDLQEAKAKGLVGEKLDGYLGVVKASPEVSRLVDDINGARKKYYREIALRNKTSLEVVEKLAGEKAIDKTPGGQYVQTTSGQWQKK